MGKSLEISENFNTVEREVILGNALRLAQPD
jgi:hypothetical protein